MRIEFLKEWMKYKIGDTATTDVVAPGVADVLFMRRIARPVPEVVPATVAPVETALIGAAPPAVVPDSEKPATRIRRRT